MCPTALQFYLVSYCLGYIASAKCIYAVFVVVYWVTFVTCSDIENALRKVDAAIEVLIDAGLKLSWWRHGWTSVDRSNEAHR